jgi:hypothetical protein
VRVDEIGKKYVEAPIRKEVPRESTGDRFRSKFRKPKGKKRKKFGRR